MQLLRRELAFEAEYPGGHGGQHWHLVMDCDAPGLYVEHTWTRVGALRDGGAETTIERYGINDFLSFDTHKPAQAGLLRVLEEMFREQQSPRASRHGRIAADAVPVA